MRFFSWLISLPVFAAVIVFILQNRMRVTLSFWPLDAELEMPVSILCLALLLIGFILGAMVSSFATFAASREARKYKKEAEKLKNTQGTATVAVPAVFVGGSYKTLSPATKAAQASWFRKIFRKGAPQ